MRRPSGRGDQHEEEELLITALSPPWGPDVVISHLVISHLLAEKVETEIKRDLRWEGVYFIYDCPGACREAECQRNHPVVWHGG